MLEWFALYVQPSKDAVTSKLLRDSGLEELAPYYVVRRKWSDRTKEIRLPLFPGYVFCRFDYRERSRVLSVRTVVRIVGSGPAPCPIEASEMSALQALMRSELPRRPVPHLQAGETVRIEEGPLRGVEGTLTDVSRRDRLSVSVVLLNRSVDVEIDRGWKMTVLPGPRAGTAAFRRVVNVTSCS